MPTITFRRASNIQNIPITDGQIIFDTARNIILMDNGNVRNQYAGATQLISTTPEATSTNAFNAQASTQLFLQKTTVIDTKANALAVNQNYVPLGCLAFKEALGTTNYANVGNGTISGALVTLNNKNNQLNSQLSANNNKFYFDYQNGKYGYNTDPNRGADTFNPFKQATHFNLGSVSQVPSGTNLTTILTELGIDPNSLTSANFIYQCTGTGVGVYQEPGAAVYGYGIKGLSMNYNSTTHVLTYTTSTSNGSPYYNVSGESTGYIHVFIDD